MRNPIRTSTALFVLSGLLASPLPAPAQGDPAAAGNRAVPKTAEPPKNLGPVISVDFPGGTVNDFIEAVRKAAAPAPVNVIRPAEAAGVQAPPISFKNVTVKTALESLRWAFQDAGEHRFQVDDFGGDSGSEPVYAVRYSRFKRGAPTDAKPDGDRQIEVFSMRDLIEAGERPEGGPNAPRDQILAAVETALHLDAGGTPPEVKYHEDTALLIVRGTNDQLNVVRNLLSRVRDDVRGRHTDTQRLSSQRRAVESELKQDMVKMDIKKQEISSIQQMLDRNRKLYDSGQTPSGDVEAAETALVRANGEMQLLRIEVERLEGELNDLNRDQLSAADAARATVEATFDISDLAPAAPEIEGLARALGTTGERRADGKKILLVVRGQPQQHEQLKQAIAAIKKAAAAAAQQKNPR